MDREFAIRCIYQGAYTYLRAFAEATSMELHSEDGAEWIAPKPGCPGPSLVYGLNLGETDAARRLDALIDRIRAGQAPGLWFHSPDWTPANILERMQAKGFQDMSHPDEPEPAMALDMRHAPQWPEPVFEVKPVRRQSELEAWCGIVNEALFECELMPAAYYTPWLVSGTVMMVVAWQGEVPVATAASICDGGIASLEFVATVEKYRRKGAATAACVAALRALKELGVRTVTLRARHDGVSLYEKLGFRTYYNTTMMQYPKQ